MARLILVDTDGGRREELARLLRLQGHALLDLEGPVEAIEAWNRGGVDLVLASVDPIGGPGRPMMRALGESSRTHMVWMGSAEVHQAVRREGAPIVGFLPVPVQEAAVEALLKRLVGDSGPRWAGRDFLEQIEGNSLDFPVPRVLHLAHRLLASGRLVVEGEGMSASVVLRNGKVIGCSGQRGLLGALDPEVEGTLEQLLGTVIAAGARPDEALQEAASNLGAWAVALPRSEQFLVRFDLDATFPGTPLPLPGSIPQMLATGSKAVRPEDVVRRDLGSRRASVVHVQLPDDAPETRWGLPPAALRMVREATRVRTLGELVGAGRNGERPETWLAADLLLTLGFLSLGRPEETPEEGDPDEESTFLSEESGMYEFVDDSSQVLVAPAPRVVSGEVDALSAKRHELEVAHARLKTASPFDAVEIKTAADATVEGVERLFRTASKAYHPDAWSAEADELQHLAAECFSLLGRAREAAGADEAGLAQLKERLEAEEAGKRWISPEERARVGMTIRIGEGHYKRRQYAEAIEVLVRVVEIDPDDWHSAFLVVLCRHALEELDATQAIEALGRVTATTPKGAAEVQFAIGEIHLKQDRARRAFKHFEAAVAADPEHIGARRYLRLRNMRASQSDPGEGDSALSKVAGLFRRKK